MTRLTRAMAAAALAACSTTALAATSETTFGPVVLHEGARFEVCLNSKYAENEVQAVIQFVRVEDGKSLTREASLTPGEGRCAAVPYERVGDAPLFAAVEVLGEPGDTDIVAGAAVVNGIFDMPKPQELLLDEGRRTATTFGPLQIPEGKRVQVCANNWRSEYESNVTVNFYVNRDALEPAISESVGLAPGEGGCTALSQAETGRARVFVEVLTEPVEPGFSNPVPVIGAFIVNGIFEAPLPPDFRLLPE